MLYAPAVGAPPVAHRSYRLLSEMLTTFIADAVPEPAVAAEQIGRAWGRASHRRRRPSDRSGEARRSLPWSTPSTASASTRTSSSDADRLDLHVSHCPFLEVAEQHHDVVCSVHLGLMRGILEQRGGVLSATGLEPLVEPSLCIAHLAR